MPSIQCEAYSNETFHCDYCKLDFQAPIVTWVDVTRDPRVKTMLQQWEFNTITCPCCGNRQRSDSPFFYEDFEEGLLIAVYPNIPEDRLSIENKIRQQYGYYPTLEFFYDMTQLWLLIYLQEHYKKSSNQLPASRLGQGEERLRNFILFLKKDPLMFAIRETVTKTLSGNNTNDDLQDILWRAFVKIEGTHPGLSDGSAHAGSMTI